MKRLNRKSVVLAAGLLLIGGGAYLNYMQAQRAAESQMSDLTLANLEAMAAFPTRPDGELPPTTGGDGDMSGGDIGIGGGSITKSCTKAQQAGSDTKGAVQGILCGSCFNTYYVRPTGSGTCTPF